MPHQQKAFDKYALSRDKIALFMEMRLGKTLVCIRWASSKFLRKILVLVPKDILLTWMEELIQEYYAYEDIKILKGTTEQRFNEAKLSTAIWNITNYATVNYRPDILKLDWDGIIIDESTCLKNPKAAFTKLILKSTAHIKYKAILTGLPNPESEKDYCEQLRFLYGHFMEKPNFWEWRRKYCRFNGFGWDVNPKYLTKIENYVAEHAYVLTAEKAGIGNKKIYVKRYTELNSIQKKYYSELAKFFEYKMADGKFAVTKYTPVKISWMYKICNGFDQELNCISEEKFYVLANLFSTELKNKAGVVWFKHTHELLYAKKYLEKRKLKCSIFYSKNKEGSDIFKTGNCQIILAQAKCGRFGLDWSRADVMVYFSNWFSGETRAQSEKRIEHPKKKSPLLYIDILCQNSIDLDIYEALKNKSKTSKQFLENVMRNWEIRNGMGIS